MAPSAHDAMFGAQYHAATTERVMVLKLHSALILKDFSLVNAAFPSMVFEAENCEGPC
jgi:hypothetical protein